MKGTEKPSKGQGNLWMIGIMVLVVCLYYFQLWTIFEQLIFVAQSVQEVL
jgi:hypothetical protein